MQRGRPDVPTDAMQLLSRTWDVVVIGGGNAALVAAISARLGGASRVLVVERAPTQFRGGNTRHTRNIRCVHASADAYNTGAYPFAEMWEDLGAIGTGPSDAKLAELTLNESESAPRWMSEQGIRWQQPLSGTLQLGRTNRFFLGGGKALVNAYHRRAEAVRVGVAYEACAVDLAVSGDTCTGVVVDASGGRHLVKAGAVICASGGFEANLDWLARYWGADAIANCIVRGPRYNDGTVLQALYDHGAKKAGQERGFHAIAVDARSPKFDGGIATRLDMIPFGVVVNSDGERFYDEGEDVWPKRYATWGSKIVAQHGQAAFALWDSKTNALFLPPMYGAFRGATLADVADQLGLPGSALAKTIADYNAAVQPGTFDPTRLDDCRTVGLSPSKSHWAQRLDDPPFFGIPMRPGITFTYMGVAINETARVRRTDAPPFANVFACGEIMSGNILSTGYLAGFGITIGTVWGRIAGREAARHVA